ncbi:plasmid mobilization protein [Chryseobacterium sp. TY4]
MRNKTLLIRMNSLEYLVIKNKAKKSGLPTAVYIRNRAMNYDIPNRLTEEEINCYKTLSKFSDNFRRISNLFKLGDVTGVKEESLATSKLIREHLTKLL